MIETLKKVLKILRPEQRKQAYLMLLLMLFAMALEVFSIGMIIPVVGIVSAPDFFIKYESINFIYEYLGSPSQNTLVIYAMCALSFSYVLKSIFIGFVSYFQSKFLFHIFPDLSQRLFNKYLKMPYGFHLKRNSADLIKNILNEANLFNQTTVGLMVTISESLVIIAIISLMIFVQPLAASLVGVIFLLCFLMYFFFLRKKMELWGHSRQYHDGLRIQHVQQGLGSIKEIKLFGRENGFASVFEVHNFGNADVLRKQYFMREVPRLAIESVAVTALAIVVVLISLGSESQTLIPTLALFAAAAFRVMPSLNRIIVMSSAVSFGKSVIDNLAKELLLEEENFKDGRTKQITFMNEIKINEVDFSYNETSQLVLKDINISISKGEMVGFIGGSGSGKTTLIDIILGLLNPTKGNILIDGIDIKKNIRNWQSSIGYVPQDIYLTDNTLKNNIAIGVDDNDICLDSIVQSYKDARLEEFIDSLEDGVNTIVGERGSRISGGQKQRIGIARALYNRPSILVLDESTSALDPETEKGILKTINALKGKMTILMITHRESTLSHCDRVFRVSDGKIKES